jgi:hypothetical protein
MAINGLVINAKKIAGLPVLFALTLVIALGVPVS